MPTFITELLTNYPWLIVAIKVLGVFAVVMPMVAYSVVAERRISAFIQDLSLIHISEPTRRYAIS